MVPPPIWMRQSGSWLGRPRGSGVNISCTTWSSTSPMPMVDEQRRDARRALQRAQADALDRHAEQAAADDDREQGHRQRRAEIRDAQPADIGADHVDRAVREIDQVRDAVDQREADREQRIDVADHKAVDGVVEPGAERGGQALPHRRLGALIGGPLAALHLDAADERIGDAPRRGVERDLAVDDARHVLDLAEALAGSPCARCRTAASRRRAG